MFGESLEHCAQLDEGHLMDMISGKFQGVLWLTAKLMSRFNPLKRRVKGNIKNVFKFANDRQEKEVLDLFLAVLKIEQEPMYRNCPDSI